MRKWKSLAPLALILAILAALVVLKQVQNRPVAIEERLQAKVTPLVPETITRGAVTRVDLYAGAKPDEKVTIERDAGDPNVWRVTSHFNAPAKKDKIDTFLDKLTDLQGEYRAGDVTGDDLNDFDLAEDAAFHVLAYTDDPDAAAVHILNGKAPKSGQIFVRAADENTIYVADVNFRNEAMIWTGEADAAPEPGPWEDMDVVKIDSEDITRVAVTMPDKQLVFEKREKPVETKEGEEAAEPPAPVYEWALASGGVAGQTFKQPGLDALVRAFDPLSAAEIVDPEKLEEWNLASPGFKCVLTLKDDKEVVLEGGLPEASADGYVRVAGASEPVVYKLSSYNFGKVFPKGSDFFDLQSLALDTETLTRIEMELPGTRAVLAKEGADWAVIEPVAELEADSTAISTLSGALAAWKASDYTDSAALGEPLRKITFTASDGASHVLEIGGPSRSIDGSYARLDGGPVVAMTKSDVGKILVEPRNLYRRALLEKIADDIQSVTLTPSGGSPLVLTRNESGAWMLGDAEADPETAGDLAETIADIQAEDILFGKSSADFVPQTTVDVTVKTGEAYRLVLGPETDAGTEFLMEGKASVFVMAKEDASALTPSADALKKPEPAAADVPEESAPAEESPAADVPEADAPAEEAPAADAPSDDAPAAEVETQQ